MHRKLLLIFACIFGLVGAMVYSMALLPNAAHVRDERTISIGELPLRVLVRDTDAERAQGLSGFPSLAPYDGMLFEFNEDGMYSFWMKDMLFPIDILWLDAEGKVITIAPLVPPESYPQPFTPDSPARYVLEIPAGFAARYGIVVGTKVSL